MTEAHAGVAGAARNQRSLIGRAAWVCASACLCALAAPPFDLWPLAFVCWAPLLVSIDGVGWQRAVGLGLLQGTLTNALTQSWVYGGLQGAAGMSAPTAAAIFASLSGWQGARSALLAALVSLASRHGWPRVAAFPLALVAAELTYPMVFPWFTAIFVHDCPALLQLADVGGPLAVSAWLGLVNASLAEASLRVRAVPALRAAAPAAATLTAVALFGCFRIHQVEQALADAPILRVGVVQGNVDKARPGGDPTVVHRTASLALLRQEPPVDLLVWPETAVSYPTRASGLSRFLRDHGLRDRRLGPNAERVDVPLLAGMVLANAMHADGDASRMRSHGESLTETLTNSAVLADRNGRILGIYDKQSLVPVGERAPFAGWAAGMRRLLPPVTDFSVLRAPAPLLLGSRRLLVSICYEDILHGAFREAVRRSQPDLLVNLTSDSWFDGSAARLHMALSKLRAVEHRRFLVRASNDGVSASVAPTGEVVWHLAPGRLATGATSVRLLRGATAYERVGDAPWVGASALSLVLAFVARPASDSARAPASGRRRSPSARSGTRSAGAGLNGRRSM